MKNSLKYLILWRKKRSELQIDDDPQADWQQMSGLLDEHLPVEKTSSKFKGLRMLPTLFIAFSAAAMVYTVSNIYTLEKHGHHKKSKSHNGRHFNPAGTVADSLATTDSSKTNDSLAFLGQNAAGHDSVIANSATSKRGASSTISPSGAPASDVPKGNAPANSTATNGGSSNNATAKASNRATTKSGVNPHQVLGSSTSFTAGKKPGPVSNKGILQFSASQNRNRPPVSGHHAYNPTGGSLTSNKAADGNRLPSGRGRRGNLVQPTGGRGYNAGNLTSGATLNQPDLTQGTYNNNNQRVQPALAVSSPWQRFDPFASSMRAMAATKIEKPQQKPPTATVPTTGKNKNAKLARVKNTNPSTTDWGLLMGVNSSGSFTPKNQNANFYGSGPVDAYFGVFASFKVNDNWAINPQVKLLNPQTISTTYAHANQSQVDSGQSLSITASRKMYSVSIPIFVTYKVADNIKLKLGPVINIPVKQINANSVLSPATLRADTTYFANTTATIKATQYQQGINLGISGGASLQFNRWIFEATYLKSLSGYKLSNGLGSFKSNNGTLQFTIGFQLDKVKP